MSVHKGQAVMLHPAHKRPTYMVDTLAALRRIRIRSDAPKVNIVVMKPMPTKRSFNVLLTPMPWMVDKIVTYYGVQAVPDNMR